ncbi:hypothetical protein CCH79_00020706, partial [Gambusia affinis]
VVPSLDGLLVSMANRNQADGFPRNDRISREGLWFCMRKSGVGEKHDRVVKVMRDRRERGGSGTSPRIGSEPFQFAVVMTGNRCNLIHLMDGWMRVTGAPFWSQAPPSWSPQDGVLESSPPGDSLPLLRDFCTHLGNRNEPWEGCVWEDRPPGSEPRRIISKGCRTPALAAWTCTLLPNPQRFSLFPNVLGQQSFSSGRFYFEVQVKGKTKWTLGVARESINRKGNINLNPQNGFWTVGLRNGNEYLAAAGPSVRLHLHPGPQKVGVFVDYQEGLVSFYDVDAAALIYSFTGCCFKEKLYSFFSPGLNDGGTNCSPLIICPVDQAGERKKKKKKKKKDWGEREVRTSTRRLCGVPLGLWTSEQNQSEPVRTSQNQSGPVRTSQDLLNDLNLDVAASPIFISQ